MAHRVKILMTYRKASFWRRLSAFLIDSVIIAMLVVTLKLIFRLDDIIWRWLDFFLFYGYNIFMDYYFQRSLGKTFCDLRVISTDKKGITFLNAFYRNVGKIISALPLMYGFFRILAPHQKQTIHDELAHCYVVEVMAQEKSRIIVADHATVR